MRRLIAVCIVLIFASATSGDVRIATRNQSANIAPGYCMWMSLQTMGDHLGIESLHDVVRFHLDEHHGASAAMVERQCEELGLKYDSRYDKDLKFLKAYVDIGRPVMIGFISSSYLGLHAVVVVDVTKTYVYWVDSNAPGSLFRYKTADFMDAWDGWGLALTDR